MLIAITLTQAEALLLLANEYNDHEAWQSIAEKIRAGHAVETFDAPDPNGVVGLHEHDNYGPHSHAVRADHLGVRQRQ